MASKAKVNSQSFTGTLSVPMAPPPSSDVTMQRKKAAWKLMRSNANYIFKINGPNLSTRTKTLLNVVPFVTSNQHPTSLWTARVHRHRHGSMPYNIWQKSTTAQPTHDFPTKSHHTKCVLALLQIYLHTSNSPFGNQLSSSIVKNPGLTPRNDLVGGLVLHITWVTNLHFGFLMTNQNGYMLVALLDPTTATNASYGTQCSTTRMMLQFRGEPQLMPQLRGEIITPKWTLRIPTNLVRT